MALAAGPRELDAERRLLRERHLLGIDRIENAGERPAAPPADPSLVPDGPGLPEVGIADLTAEIVRAAIATRGSLIVRGVIGAEEAAALRDGVDRAFAARDGDAPDPRFYEEFEPEPPMVLVERQWIVSSGAYWTADSPALAYDVLGIYERTGLARVAAEYLGEPPLLSINKCVLRRVGPDANPGWHQDGAFLGDVTALNVWLALSRCGDVAPGVDVVARRLDELAPKGTEGADFDWSVAATVAERVAGGAGIARPVFEAGDALLFDHLCLHATAATPEMTETRYAAETWFFGPSAYPDGYVPLGI